MNDPIPAIGYIRVSTAREEMISPEIQRASITDWARRNGRDVITWVEDLDQTGRNFRRRITEAIDAIQKGDAREIIVWRFSRFGRTRRGWAVHLDEVESAGGALQSATEQVDASTAAGRLQRGIHAEFAAYESDRFGEQWRETHDLRRGKGLPHGGTPRWGYVRKGRIPVPGATSHFVRDPADPAGERYEPDPGTAPVLEGLYERYVAGEGSQTLTKWLNGRGYRTTRGNAWTTITLFAVLDSGFAAGLLRVHSTTCACKHRARCRHVTYIPGSQPPIITRELWEAYRARRDQQRAYPPRSRRAVYPLSGLMRCAQCGHGMSISHGMGQPGYGYRCTIWQQRRECVGVWIRRTVAEDAVLDWLRGVAGEIEAEAAAAKVPDHRPPAPARPDSERIGEQITKIERALARLTRMRALDDDDSPAAEREFVAARDDLRAQRAQLEQQLADVPAEPPRREDFGPVIDHLIGDWEIIPVASRRDLLASVIARVEIHRTGFRTPPRVEVIPVWAGGV